MPKLLRSKPGLVGLLVVALGMAAIGFLPLFDGPGYESALAAGLFVPMATAIVTAIEIANARPEPFDAFNRGVANGAALAAGAYATTLLHGLRAGFCDFWGGSAHVLLGPAAGALLAGAWGALAGELAGRRKGPRARLAQATATAAALPLASIALSLVRFYTSPIVFAYDPFVGFFSGTLYDTVIDWSGLSSYRAGTAATLLASFVAALHLERDARGRLAFHRIGRPGMLALGGVALCASLASILFGDRLGHWQTAQTIAAELGGATHGERCDVLHARGMDPNQASLLARDCDAHVRAIEDWMGASLEGRITVYVFRDAAQKGALMGAVDTNIAKPWRREIYVQEAPYPHPVIGHEIAHVVAGSFGRGPFRIAGRLGGLLPDPGLIEGIAVAASPREGDLDPRQWARTMKDLGLLPPLRRLFALGFLGENSSLAYTASGAFVGWVRDRWGPDVLRAWYGGRDLAEIVGEPWATIERAWHEDLDRAVVPEAAMTQARERFDRPGVFARRCPHVVDGCKRDAEVLKAAGDWAGARERYERVLSLDEGDHGSKIQLGLAWIRAGRIDEGKAALERIVADERLPRHVRDQALEEIADLLLATGDVPGAVSRYDELATRTADEARLRTLDVKRHAARDPEMREAIVALLVGAPGRSPDKLHAAELLGGWAAARPADGLPRYLLARMALGAGDYQRAAAHLDRALASSLALPRVQAEAERLRIVVACARGEVEIARRMLEAYTHRPTVMPARAAAARALAARCAASSNAGGEAARGSGNDRGP